MPNRFGRQVSFTPFEAKGLLPEGQIDVSRPRGEGAAALADSFGSLAHKTGAIADVLAAKEGTRAGLKAGSEGTPDLRDDATIRGEAFDKAAISAFGWRLETKVGTDLDAAWAEHRDDPKGLEQKLTEIKQGYLSEANLDGDPRLTEIFARSFEVKAAAYRANANERAIDRQHADAAAAAAELTDAQMIETERQAFLLPPGTEGDAVFGELVGRATRQIDTMVKAGAMTPAAGARERQSIVTNATRARLRSVFDALPDPEAKAVFADGLVKQWAEGAAPLKGLDFAGVTTIADGLASDARQEASARELLERDGDMAVKKDAVDLIANGQMTSDWLTAHRDDLDITTYRAAVRATTPGGATAKTSPRDYIQLLDLAESDPPAAASQAREAFADGRLAKDDFNRIIGTATRNSTEETRKPYVKEAQRFVRRAVQAPQDASIEELQDQRDTMDLFNEWVAANPSADATKVRGYADELVRHRKRELATWRMQSTPLPSFARVPDRSAFNRLELDKAAARLKLAIQGGVKGSPLSDEAARREAAALQQWDRLFRERDDGGQ